MQFTGMTLAGGFTLQQPPPPPMSLQFDVGLNGSGVRDGNLQARVSLGPVPGVQPNAIIDWGDGNTTTVTTSGNYTKTYASTGLKNVTITGYVPRVGPDNPFLNGGTMWNLKRVDSWGSGLGTTSLEYACAGVKADIEYVAGPPGTVTTLKSMFERSRVPNDPNISNWNVSNVTNMNQLFESFEAQTPSVFNQPLNNWDVSKVTNMGSIFGRLTAFNQPLNNWNVSNVTNMDYAFFGTSSFNQNLSSWITGLTAQPTGFSQTGNATFANNANNLKPFLSNGTTRINT